MKLIRHLPARADRPTAVAIGNFDGIHLGHQAVLKAMIAAAERARAVPSVLTFEPHPRAFFKPDLPAFRLKRLGTKLTRLKEAGVARVYMPRFDARFANMPAEDFLDAVLGQAIGAKIVVTGDNFAFGKGRRGDIEMLRAWGVANNIEIVTVPAVSVDGQAFSSSGVRRALEAGDVALVAQLLGRPYTLTGRVVHGDHRGREFGYPTANLALPAVLKLPAFGIYAVRATVRGKIYQGAASLGVKPTVSDNAKPTLEVHLFDFDGDLYGAKMEVTFVARIRGEEKFDSVDTLIAKIAEDCAVAKKLLETEQQNTSRP